MAVLNLNERKQPMNIEDIKLPAKFRLTKKGAKAGVWFGSEGEVQEMDFFDGDLSNHEYHLSQEMFDKGYVELVEDSTPIWFGKKYCVTPKTSEMLQKEVFAAGGSWINGETHVKWLDDNHLFISERGSISRAGGDIEYFELKELPEATIFIKKELAIESVKEYDKTVEVNGKKYRLKDIEALEEVV